MTSLSDQSLIATSFLVFLTAFTAIGLASALRSRGTKRDYYLANNAVSPWLVGLSAVATNNSGYMFIGVIGYTYFTGLPSIWLMIGWISGDFLASLFVHKRLREATDKTGEVSYAGVLSRWYGADNNRLQQLMGLISLVFLMAYASAQLVAGGKALHALFDWPPWLGAALGAVMVAAYCVAGGIRASIWTDAAQSTVMIVAMALLLLVTLDSLGGASAAITQMRQVDGFMDWYPRDLVVPGIAGGLLFALAWMFAGLSVIGQPHVMVRFMTLDDHAKMRRARMWYYLWFTAFYCLATSVGMLSRVYLPDAGSFDAELALPMMALELLPPYLVGLILAGIFAATISTADSLILSCSATVTHDLAPRKTEKTLQIKITTIAITGIALLLALSNNQSVFSLVIMAWSALASAFAPLLIVQSLRYKSSELVSITAVIVGLSVALAWRWMGWHESVYEGLPGIMSGLLFLFAANKMHVQN